MMGKIYIKRSITEARNLEHDDDFNDSADCEGESRHPEFGAAFEESNNYRVSYRAVWVLVLILVGTYIYNG